MGARSAPNRGQQNRSKVPVATAQVAQPTIRFKGRMETNPKFSSEPIERG
jgi:hypothetical protein